MKPIKTLGTETASSADTSRETMGSKLPRSDISSSSSSLPEVHREGGQQESSQRRHVADMPSISKLPDNPNDGRGTNHFCGAECQPLDVFLLRVDECRGTAWQMPVKAFRCRQEKSCTDLFEIGCGRDGQLSRDVLARLGPAHRGSLWNGCHLDHSLGNTETAGSGNSWRPRHCWITPSCCELSKHR